MEPLRPESEYETLEHLHEPAVTTEAAYFLRHSMDRNRFEEAVQELLREHDSRQPQGVFY